MSIELRNFLALSYDELEELNLKAKDQRKNRVAPDQVQEERLKYLTDEKRIKAVTVLFSDLEGRLHMLDYDKKFLLKSYDNLTFDGSSIRGFTAQRESDLRLGIDWSAFYWAPADVFGSGKVLVFGEVIDKDGTPYSGDIRGVLKTFATELYKKKGYTLNAANEIEGFLFKGADAERHYHETGKFEYVNTGGYYHSLPGRSAARPSSTPPPKCSAPWDSRTRRTIPKSRLRSLKSTTATAKWSQPPTRFSSTSSSAARSRRNMGLTASFLAQAGRRCQRQRHAHERLHQQKRQESFLGSEGRRETQQAGLGFRRPHSDAWQRHLPAAESRASTPIAASIPTSRLPIRSKPRARRSRLDGPHSDRQREEHARRSSLRRPGRESLHGDAMASSRPASMAKPSKIKNLRQAERYLPDNIYTALDDFKQRHVDDQAAGRRCEGPLRRPETGLRRPLPAASGNFRQSAGSAVSPRSVQPVPLESVLKLSSSAGYALASNPGHFSTPACERLTPASSIPKIAVRIHRHRIQLCKMSAQRTAPRNLFRAIATDIHFWIPLVVLIGGILLLDKLR